MDRQQLQTLVSSTGASIPIANAFAKTDRAEFVPEELESVAYEDKPVPLPEGQTTSQPSLIALILDHLALGKGARVLEVGTGFGFQTALLSELVGAKGLVVSIEYFRSLHEQAKKRLAGRKNVLLLHADGKKGFAEKAPFDAIVVSAACAELPPKLFAQLKKGGRLAYPQETGFGQDLVLVEKTAEGKKKTTPLLPVAFVQLR
ncbi:protein-L-isoaspartate O-methyltransferase [Candidatus Micrarchaeota archaeon]|nr:protein-L-isoaspartate O-methyltransferase [Candidatus Micrarchaeota archaeon]